MLCLPEDVDISTGMSIEDSEWFRRGWTLQEPLAPENICFVDQKWSDIGTKAGLKSELHNATGIPMAVLAGEVDIETASVAQRMSWASRRRTTRLEDGAYCLMGIFGINMPLLYGEGENAFIRLQHEIMQASNDQTLLAWKSTDHRGGILATSAAAFENCQDIIQLVDQFDMSSSESFAISGIGVTLDLPFIGYGP